MYKIPEDVVECILYEPIFEIKIRLVYSEWMLNFYLFCLSKIFEDVVLLGSADGKVFLYVFVFW